MIDTILHQIETYQAQSETDQIIKSQFLQFIAAHPQNCLLRSNLSGHLTASAWVIDSETRSKCVLVHHVKLNCWLQPGGHADGDADLLQVALRELEEETGIKEAMSEKQIFDLDVHAIPWHKHVPPHLHFDVRYLVFASHQQLLISSAESHAVAWVDMASLTTAKTDQSVLRLVAKSSER